MKRRSAFASAGLFFISISLMVSCTQSTSKKVITPDAASAADASTTTPIQASSNKIIRLGFSNWPGYMPWHVSEKNNLFKSEKAKLVPVWYDDYLKGIGALVAGQLDANSQTLIDTVLSVAENSDQVVVLVNDNSTGNDKIIGKAGINSISDLKGKVISTEKGTVDHYLLLLALKKAGLSQKDVTIKFMGIEESAKEFAEGKVDATSVFAPATNTALKLPGSKELASSKDFPGAISDVLSFRRDFVEKNPEIVQATVDNWFDTLKYIKSNAAKSNDAMAKQSKVSVAEYVEFEKGIKIFDVADNLKAFQPGNDNTSLAFSAEDLKKTLVNLGMTKNSPNLNKLFDDRFVKAYAAKHK
jgi:NitT/TauT family transport system substrate-binding protein